MKIGIQGQIGSYDEIVTNQLFNQAEIIFTNTFSQVFDDLMSGKSDKAVVAIANNRYGFIPEAYSEIIDHYDQIYLTDEYYLPIKHQLLVNHGTTIKDIKNVISQSAAIGQCHKFLEKYLPHVEIIEYTDTAGSAKLIADNKSRDSAVIASLRASELYNLEIINKDIQDDSDNITRFVVVEKKAKHIWPIHADKTTAILQTSQKPGSLADILQIFKQMNINIETLHSSFIPNTDFHIQFFIEFDMGARHQDFEMLRRNIDSNLGQLNVIGSYKAKHLTGKLDNKE